MRRKSIDLSREYIAFCYRPSPGKPPVRVRQSKTWPKGIVSVLAVGIVAAALLAVLLFAPTRMAISRLFTSLFAVRQIVIETSGDLNTASIASNLTSRLGRSLLDLSAQDVEDVVSPLPQVQSMDFRKLFPSTLVVSLHERKPRFAAEMEGGWFELSGDGVVLSQIVEGDKTRLPRVQGFEFDGHGSGCKVKSDYFGEFIELCNSLVDLAPELIGPNSQILVRDRIEVEVRPQPKDAPIVFSLKDPVRQLKKYMAAASEIAARRGDFASVDLRYRGQIVLKKNVG
ncbi:MAG: FtsQ-type POTRA domain-containing protein [Candidatus Coatesbacteria bacterium]|nr:FtsQ-type POTRA domain-containing protein [Candidatus Coatesbacteria bacterium]